VNDTLELVIKSMGRQNQENLAELDAWADRSWARL